MEHVKAQYAQTHLSALTDPFDLMSLSGIATLW